MSTVYNYIVQLNNKMMKKSVSERTEITGYD